MVNLKYMCLIVVLVSILISISSPALAKSEILRASYKYTMGDNDTKNDAKTLCFIGAKRRLMEQVGTYIVSHTEVNNFKLTRDEITSFSAAFLKIEVEHEKIENIGEQTAIVMVLKTNVDTDEVKSNLDRIVKDASLKKEIAEKDIKISELESKIQNLQKHLTTANYEKSFQLREERKDAFQDLYSENETLRKIILAAKERDTTRSRTIKSQSAIVRSILENVQLGMTPEEIRQIIKLLSGSDEEFRMGYTRYNWSWERLKFNFEYDDILKIHCLKNILYDGADYETRSTDYATLKDIGVNVLLNGLPTWSNGKPSRFIEKNEIREKHPGLYKYIWGDQ